MLSYKETPVDVIESPVRKLRIVYGLEGQEKLDRAFLLAWSYNWL